MTTATVIVKAFGITAEKTGRSEIELPAVADTEQLLAELFRLFPALREVKFAIAVDRKIAAANTPIGPNSEIALLPPFSGG